MIRNRPRRARLAHSMGLLALWLAVSLCGGRASAAVRLVYAPPRGVEAREPLAVNVGIAGAFTADQLESADVVIAGAAGWTYVPMALARNTLTAEVPARLIVPPSLSYFIRLTDIEGRVTVLPPGAPGSGTFAVPVFELKAPAATASGSRPETLPESGAETEPPAEHSEGVEIVSPLPYEVVPEERPSIAVLVTPPMAEPRQPFALLDGLDVTELLEVGPDYAVLVPARPLEVGAHRVMISVLTPGRTVEASWTFYVRSKEGPGGGALSEVYRAAAARTSGVFGEAAWQLHGRIELGWASVVAETTATDSVDVFLPFEEVSSPTLDFYASATRGDASLLVSAQYNPVYDEDAAWSLTAETRRFSLRAGDVYPSLSGTTLDWAFGQGGALEARIGRLSTELVAMRMSEADTVAGFGVYSRFAVAARQSVVWGERSSLSAVYMYAFDRESSVPETLRITDPLANTVAAGVISTGVGPLLLEVEGSLSRADGPVTGDGTALRTRIDYGRDPSRRVSLEYVTSEPSFYSAGSFEYESGESGLRAEGVYGSPDGFTASGSFGVFSTIGSERVAGTNGYETRFYGRADLASDTPVGSVRSFLSLKYDRVPYESYDYSYYYAAGGGILRRERLRVSVSSSWSRSESADTRDVLTESAEVRYDIMPAAWSVTAGGRATFGVGDAASYDYTRFRWTLATRRTVGRYDFALGYELLDRNDESDPAGDYTEHVLTATVARAF